MSEEHYTTAHPNRAWQSLYGDFEAPCFMVMYGNDSLSSPSSSWLYIW